MQIVIDMPENIYNTIADDDIISARYVKNGVILRKGHGRLIDAEAFERRCMFDSDIEDMQDVIYALRDYPSDIEADRSEK